ncbi:ABC-2 type transport system permease protein [Novosphingobium hassiacum]|uniref:ABC-2 type transport system permease protein n=1 Tax=Novosphingobium hassiacum TaxID=173676 RepID=A0A7W5ZXF6_9SPHN|nr:ABC transporter permease [Novosphingobium hassiacum]MBB3859957.1 ABC-2 type transport system permease protein [Novosphingobium hassiacum]
MIAMPEKLRAALVIARRDFVAVIFSKTFIFFLIGPLFPVLVGGMAGNIGNKVQQNADRPTIGVAMAGADADRLLAARAELNGRLAGQFPELVVLKRVAPGQSFDARVALANDKQRVTAVVGGTLDAPTLTGPTERVRQWVGLVSNMAAHARSSSAMTYPDVAVTEVNTSVAKVRSTQAYVAQGSQVVLFLLTMLLAGMVLSNLVEEKGNKIIEVLAAAIPLDAMFMGKLFAMLGVSLVGIAVWGSVGGLLILIGGQGLPAMTAPAVGWPLFALLGFLYFTMAYLLMGSLFLSIGGMASTVREVQTLSMPVSMFQLMVFFFASYALSSPGTWVEWASLIFPVSSPYAMLARAAQEPEIWPHLVALAWQVLWVVLIVRAGASLFRRTVMKSGPSRPNPAGLLVRLIWRRQGEAY